MLIACTVYMLTTSKDTDKMTYSEVKDLFTSEKVQSFVYDGTSNKLTMKVRDASAKNGTKEVAYNMYSFSLFYEDLGDTIEQQYKDGIIKEYQIEPIRSSWWIQLIPYILLVGLMVFWVVMMTKANGGGGVGGGIEKFCNVGMPCLFVILIIVIVYVAVQPGAVGGYQFMFGVNFEPLEKDFLKVLKTAAGQMFFSLSLGMGAMITYGSYMKKSEKIQRNAVIIVVMDTLAAIMAGMIVMPACYAFLGGETGSGPSLLFKSMQVVFYNMGGFIGNLMGFLFYFLVFIAAISSSMSLLEAISSAKIDANVEKGKAPNRKKAAIMFSVLVLIFALPVALDGIGAGQAGGAVLPTPAELFGMTGDSIRMWNDCWLDFYDVLSEGLLMPIGAMIMTFAIGWIWKMDFVVEECEASGHKFWGKAFFNICYKFITPIGMLFVLYGQITDYFG